MGKILAMRLMWNAGAAILVTAMLTSFAALGSDPAHPALDAPVVSVPAAGLPHRHYSGLAEHFQAANTTADGRLTLAQTVQANWKRVARHFDEIDTGHVGFITEQQIHAYTTRHRHGSRPASEV